MCVCVCVCVSVWSGSFHVWGIRRGSGRRGRGMVSWVVEVEVEVVVEGEGGASARASADHWGTSSPRSAPVFVRRVPSPAWPVVWMAGSLARFGFLGHSLSLSRSRFLISCAPRTRLRSASPGGQRSGYCRDCFPESRGQPTGVSLQGSAYRLRGKPLKSP